MQMCRFVQSTRSLAIICSFFLSFLTSCDTSGGQNQVPSVSFSASTVEPRVGTPVSFTADASDPDGEITSYDWKFGDGTSASDSSVSHVYESSGSYSVQLTVTDDRGISSKASRAIDVRQRLTEVTITQIEVKNMPFTDEDGASWDSSSGPDAYLTRVNVPEGARVGRTSTTYDDVAPQGLPLSYDASFTIGDLSEEQSINLLDADSTDTDDYIEGAKYTFGELTGEYPDSLTTRSEDGTVEYKFALEWEN